METEKTLLDDLKKIEEAKQKRLLSKILNTIKENAYEILCLKESYNIYMEELGISDKEAKRVIDWINSLVKITDKDRADLREEIRKELKEDRKKVDKKAEEAPFSAYATLTSPSYFTTSANTCKTSSAMPLAYSGSTVLCSTNANTIEVK